MHDLETELPYLYHYDESHAKRHQLTRALSNLRYDTRFNYEASCVTNVNIHKMMKKIIILLCPLGQSTTDLDMLLAEISGWN